MPFAGELTTDQLDDLRDDVYWASINVAYCPNDVVFQALTNQGIAQGTFAQFNYDNVTVGAYTDVKVNMVVYITTSTSLRSPIWVGRVRELPTATVIKINETAIVLQEDWYVTVIDDRRYFEKLGRVAPNGDILLDWNIAYSPPAPVIYNLQSGYVNPALTGSASFDFEPEADAVQPGETITGWLWEVADGTITSGTDTDQDITVSFPQGFRWVRLNVTSSNGQTNFMDFAVWVGTEFVIPNVVMPQISDDVDSGAGYTVTIQGYHTEATTLLRTLLNKTLVCLYSTEYLSPTIVTNIDMIGRIINEDGGTRGDEQHSEIQEVGFEVQGIGAQMAAGSVSPFRLEDSTSPATWLQYEEPTPDRLFLHMATRLSTLSQICSLQRNIDNDIYVDKSLQNEETSFGAGVTRMLGYIQAKLNFAPSGEIRVEREAFYADGSALDTVADLDYDLGDLIEFNIRVEYQETSGSVVAAGSRYNRATGEVDYLTANAPPTSQGEGEFIKKLDGVLIPDGLTDDEAKTYLAELAGVFFALSQPLIKMRVRFFDAWRNILIPNCFQWYTFNLPANSNPRGLIFTSSQRWLLLSISRDIDTETGRTVCVGDFVLEPSPANAQILAALLPDVVVPELSALPPIDAYAAFPPNPAINYPTDDPDDFDLQPIDIGSGYQAYSPLDQNAAQEAANNAGSPGCRTFNVFFSNPSNVTGFTLQPAAIYTFTVSGDAQISVPGSCYDNESSFFELVTGTVQTDPTLNFVRAPGANQYAEFEIDFHQQVELADGSYIQFQQIIGAGFGPDDGQLEIYNGLTLVATLASRNNPNDGGYFWQQVNAGPAAGEIFTRAVFRYRWANGIGDVRGQICTNGAGGPVDRGDAFFHSYNPEAGGLAQAYVSAGLYLQNAPVPTIPAFNPQHKYTFQFTGDGNPLLMRYAAADYSGIQNVPLVVEVCGPGANNFRR